MNTILFNGALVIASALCLAGCEAKDDAALSPSRARRLRTQTNARIYLVEFEGHDYIIFEDYRRGGIVHSESCTCKKGGAE